MNSTNDRRGYLSKRPDDPTGPSGHGDGKGKTSSWQRSVKRKLPPSACELPPQARKLDRTLCTSHNLGPPRVLASVRKSLSDPLRVFGDGDESNHQHRSLSGTNPSDSKDGLSKDHNGGHDASEGLENLSMEKRRGLKPGLKDSTNLDTKAALKHASLYNEVLVLKEALRAERETHQALQAELDEERNAASSAANEAMSMIARLQEEKAAVLMEARQFKRMAEERELHSQEAISLLKEMLMNKEEEALALENDLFACRQMFLALEGREPIQVSRDSQQLSLFANDLSRESFKDEQVNSEFNGRSFARGFKGFATDSIRGNLEHFFNRAEEVIEERTWTNCKDMQCKEEFSGMMHDKVVDFSTSVGEQDCSIDGAIHDIGHCDNFEQTTPPPTGKTHFECQSEPPEFCTDEQSRSLWDRIMKLEHRLETFGVVKQGFEFDLPGSVAPTPQTPAFTSCKQQVSASCLDRTSCSTLNPQEGEVNKRGYVERLGKLQSTGGSHGLEAEMRQLKSSEISFSKNQMQASFESLQGRNTSHIAEQLCEIVRDDIVEVVHDVYEVGYQSNQGSHNECCLSPGIDGCCNDQPSSIKKPPDSPLELMAPVMESMAVSPPDSAVVENLSSSLSGAELQQLSKRLQVLENEKHSMHQAILSLQAENKELRTLQGGAFQVQDLKQVQKLKRSLLISEQPNKRAKSEQTSFTSILRGLFSYFPSGTNSENHSMAKDDVGLPHLLEKSPHSKTETLIVRGLKVKVPAAT